MATTMTITTKVKKTGFMYDLKKIGKGRRTHKWQPVGLTGDSLCQTISGLQTSGL